MVGLTPCAAAQTPGEGLWYETFRDDFNGAAGARPDASVWNIETGGHGWGNNEQQTYTARPENVSLDGQGNLALTARSEWHAGHDGIWQPYTSARITTQGNFSQAFGRFEARLRLPVGQGLWPAFWMLGDDISSQGWPQSGEIDIMENIGSQPATVHGTIHGPGYSGGGGIGAAYYNPGGQWFNDTFHTFAVEWTPWGIDWLVDGNVYQTRTRGDVGGNAWVFDDEFFMILNVAVGGGFPGSPDGSTNFPQQMLIDYVSVHQRTVATRQAIQSPGFRGDNGAWLLNSNSYIEGHDADGSPSRIAFHGEGDAALKLFGSFDNDAPETEALQPFLAITPGETHLFAAAVRTNSDDSIAGTDNRLEMFVAYYDGYYQWMGEHRITALDGESAEDAWRFVDVELTPIDGAAYADVGFRLVQPGVAGGAAWADLVRFGLLEEIGITGDLDGDGFVGAADLDLVLAHWGQSPTDPRHDADGDGLIGRGDLEIVTATFGNGTPPGGGVPEPGGLALLGLAWGAVSGRRRR